MTLSFPPLNLPPQLLALALLIVVLIAVAFALLIWSLFATGQWIIISDNNVGNILLQYYTAVSLAVRRGQDVNIRWFPVRGRRYLKMCPMIQALPSRLTFDKTQDHWAALHRALSGCRDLPNMAGAEVLWWTRRECDVYLAMQPYMAAMLNNIVSATANKATPLPDIVIHFRCSDSPFNRLINYTFLRYDFYGLIVRYAQQHIFRRPVHVVVLACSQHGSRPAWKQATKVYLDDLCNYLRPLAARLDVQCGSIESDFSLMLRAPLLVSSGSSMSFVAALARFGSSSSSSTTSQHLPVIMPSSVFDPEGQGLTYRNTCLLIGSGNWRLPHNQVRNYLDTERVCQQLRQPTESSRVQTQLLSGLHLLG